MPGKFMINDNFSHIGGGSYGEVYRIFDIKEFNSPVVIKRNLVDENTSYNVSVRELDILVLLQDHPNIVKLLGVSFTDPFLNNKINKPPKRLRNDNIYFIFENAECDLSTYLQTNELSVEEIKSFTRDILLGLNYIHKLGLIHRDIKTSNLLVFQEDGKKHIKICDFGFTKQNITHLKSPKIVTSWYRSPEICCQSTKYDHKIDIWSMGCVIYEMMVRLPLCYKCADDDRSLISYLCSKLPMESFYGINSYLKDQILKISAYPIPTNDNNFKSSIPAKYRENKHLYQLMIDMLMVDPDKRLDTENALNSEFIYSQEVEDISSQYNTTLKYFIENTNIKIVHSQERAYYTELAFSLYNNRHNLTWYDPRIIFQAISMMDRYFTWLIETKKEKNKDGSFHSQEGIKIRFSICVYLAIKYFHTNNFIPSFDQMINMRTSNLGDFILKFEVLLISKVFNYRIFENTLLEYETFRKNRELESVEVCNLLVKYGTVKRFEGTIKKFHNKIFEK